MDSPTFTSSVHYRDPKAALAWLERAFGFEVTMAIDGPPEAPEMCHYEMSCAGRGRIMVGAEWADWVRRARQRRRGQHPVGPRHAERGLDEHCERARAAGAAIAAEPGGPVLRRPHLPGRSTSRGTAGRSRSTSATSPAPRPRPPSASRSWPPAGRERRGRTARRHAGRAGRSGPAPGGRAARRATPTGRRARPTRFASTPSAMSKHLRVLRAERPGHRDPPRLRRPGPDLLAALGADDRAAERGSTPPSGAGPSSSPPSPTISSASRDRGITGARGAAGAGPPARAFAAFTEEIGQWWRPNGLFQFTDGRTGTLAFEPGPDGRLVETYADGSSFVVGHIRVWDPPHRLVVSWRHASFAPDQETELHVRFDDETAGATQTRVTVEHFGWDTIPREHAARHGFPLATFQLRFAEWWQVLLRELSDRASS